MTDVDVLVVGAGLAGLTVALGVHGARTVRVIADGTGSTAWAQGGLAAATSADDSAREHAADTMTAGASLCDPVALDLLTREAPLRVAELIGDGAVFDRDADGALSRTIEGGHRRHRVVHAGGDASGAEVARVLRTRAEHAGIPLTAGRVTGLIAGSRGQVAGAVVRTASGVEHVTARAVVLATGGIGGVFAATTNPSDVDGRGLALALRAGASLTDLEFVQFHPTVLPGAGGQRALVTEAVRGEGAVLRDREGRPIMAGRHPLADLAPRDVVAREIDAVLTRDGLDHVLLDATGIPADVFARRFPTVLGFCARLGLDPSRTPIPVSPAEHFLCGGVRTDEYGATDVTGLYAVGEAAATGVHGANRLASNSLVEGLVFGRRVAARLVLDPPSPVAGERVVELGTDPDPAAVRAVTSRYAGIRRDRAGLGAAAERLDGFGSGPLATVAAALVTAAAARTESRGCHWRRDHPTARPDWRRHVAVRLDPDGRPSTVARGEPNRAA
jgi:L-aspartate oxidase